MAKTVKLADYLFTRLRQLGVESVFGVPGDYNLQLLDFVKPAELHWVGTCNELNGGYAADAYSRVKGISALITTFGVGELSAINAIAGAYAELAPVVHIVGTPSRQLQSSRALTHHTLNDGNFRRFAQMHALVTVAQASISDPRSAADQIDSTLKQCLMHHRPVYIEIPVDMVDSQIDASSLDAKITVPDLMSDERADGVIHGIVTSMRGSKQPMILVDGEIRAHGTVNEVNELIALTNWPTYTSSFAKGLVDETRQNVYGVYRGALRPDQQFFVDHSDFIICFGPHFSTTNSFAGTAVPKSKFMVVIDATEVRIADEAFRDLPAKPFVRKLLQRFKDESFNQYSQSHREGRANGHTISGQLPPDNEQIKQDHLKGWISGLLRSGDTVLAETGTAGFVARDFSLPQGTGYLSHTTWLSIGYMLPAALGVAIARREILQKAGKEKDSSRTILLIGDGSLQMTVQEISTMIREKLNIIIFVVNNKGYLIERCIHGWKQAYNDIADWRYLEAPKFFGAKEGEYDVWKCKTNGELIKALDDDGKLVNGKGLRMVELILDPDDAPRSLWDMLQISMGRTRQDIMNGP